MAPWFPLLHTSSRSLTSSLALIKQYQKLDKVCQKAVIVAKISIRLRLTMHWIALEGRERESKREKERGRESQLRSRRAAQERKTRVRGEKGKRERESVESQVRDILRDH